MDFSIYCLSLKKSKRRRAIFDCEAQKLGFPYTYVDAIDASLINSRELQSHADQKKSFEIYGKVLTPMEIACALGHRKIYQLLCNSGKDAALIFEDDVIIDKDIEIVLKALRNSTLNITNFIFFFRQRTSKQGRLILSKTNQIPLPGPYSFKNIEKSNGCLKGSDAYLISRNAAKNLLAKPKIECVADAWEYWFYNETISEMRFVDPPLITHNEKIPSIIKRHRFWVLSKFPFLKKFKI